MKLGWITFSLMLLVFDLKLPAQNPFVRHYTTADGLPSNTVYYVFQDSKKFIWFATNAGVARYDGSHFDYFTKSDGLGSNEVVRIQEDSFGRIWFFNLNGSFNFFLDNRIFNEHNAPFLDSLKSQEFFRSFFQDTDKTIYFYYNHQGDIVALDSMNNIKRFRIPSIMFYDTSLKDSIEWMIIRHISKSASGEFILWTQAGLFKLKALDDTPLPISNGFSLQNVFPSKGGSKFVFGTWLNSGEPVFFRFNNERISDTILSPLALKSVFKLVGSVLEDIDGFLWISTFDEGLICMADKQEIIRLDIKEGQALMQDHEKNIWISSMQDGVYKLTPSFNRYKHYPKPISGYNGVTAMAGNPDGSIWITNGSRISLFHHNDFYPMDFLNKEGTFNRIEFLGNNILMVWQKGTACYLFQGTTVDSLSRTVSFKRIQRSSHHIKEVALDHTGNELVSFGHVYFLRFFPGQNPLIFKRTGIDERIYYVFYNHHNELVINTRTNYLFRDGKLYPYKALEYFANRIIYDHLQLNDSIELFNIEGDSLFLFSDNRLINLTTALDYPFHFQVNHMEYAASRLYLASNSSIYFCDNPVELFHGRQVVLKPFDITFRNIQDIHASDGVLHIASEDGLTAIPDSLLSPVRTLVPIPYFRSISIDDKEIQPGQTEIVFRGNNRIKVVFGSKNYSSQETIFSYMLDGVDKDWISGNGNNVIFQGLSPGVYLLKLRARKFNSPWSEPIEFRITVRSTIWQHPLFYILLSILLVGFVARVIIRRKNRQLKQQEIDNQLVTLEQKALQSMMNPHFIFNALGSIQNFLLQNKSREAGLYLSQFARLIRQNLNAITTANINLEEEVDRLRNYLDLEKLRTGDKFEYEIDVDENLDPEEVFIPSMIIQPFVENAIWHGISNIDEKGEINVKFRKIDDMSIKIIIKDNGIGMQNSQALASRSDKHLHLGMDMTRRRLDLFGKKYSMKTSIEHCEVSPGLPNPGTRVVVIVPMMHNRDSN